MPADNIVLLTANVVNVFRVSPFITKQLSRISAEAAATVLGADMPGTSDATKRALIKGNGVKTSWNATELPLMASSNTPNAAGFVIGDHLRTIVLTRGLTGVWTPLIRVGSDTGLTSGRFRVTSAAGNTLEFNTAPTGDVMVLVLPSTDTITLTGGAMVQDRPYDIETPSFLVTASAVTSLQRLLR